MRPEPPPLPTNPYQGPDRTPEHLAWHHGFMAALEHREMVREHQRLVDEHDLWEAQMTFLWGRPEPRPAGDAHPDSDSVEQL